MKKLISIVLAIVILLPCLFGCATTETEETTSNDEVVTTSRYEDFPDIAKQDNGGKQFNIIYPQWMLYENYYFAEEYSGELVDKANYERDVSIEEYLGIDLVSMSGGDIDSTINKIKTAKMGGMDDYQLALTHCYSSVISAATGGFFEDLSNTPNLNLDAKYWRKEQMQSVAIDGAMYLGTGSYIIPDPCVMLFNKDMISKYGDLSVDDLYQSVVDKKWTVEKLKLYASHVAVDVNENIDPKDGTYGFTTMDDWTLCSFMAPSNYFIVEPTSNGKYDLLDFNERIDNIIDVVGSLYSSDYTYVWSSANPYPITVGSGRTMFVTESLSDTIKTVSLSESHAGILPIPAIEEGMEHQQLDWAGYVVIPSSVVDKQLSGAVLELLCYFGEKDVYPAFYEKILGSRTADAPKDAEMIDIIFDSLVLDPGLAFLNNGASAMANIFYVVPRVLKRGGEGVSSWYEKNYDAALIALYQVIYPK